MGSAARTVRHASLRCPPSARNDGTRRQHGKEEPGGDGAGTALTPDVPAHQNRRSRGWPGSPGALGARLDSGDRWRRSRRLATASLPYPGRDRDCAGEAFIPCRKGSTRALHPGTYHGGRHRPSKTSAHSAAGSTPAAGGSRSRAPPGATRRRDTSRPASRPGWGGAGEHPPLFPQGRRAGTHTGTRLESTMTGSSFDAPTSARALGAAGVEHRLDKRSAPGRGQPKRAPGGRPRTGPAGARQ